MILLYYFFLTRAVPLGRAFFKDDVWRSSNRLLDERDFACTVL